MEAHTIVAFLRENWTISIVVFLIAGSVVVNFLGERQRFFMWYVLMVVIAWLISAFTQHGFVYFYAFLLGMVTAFAEIISKFTDEPVQSLKTSAAVFYHLFNGLISAFSLGFLILSGVSISTPLDKLKLVLAAGLGSMLIMRSKLFGFKAGGEDISIGPEQVIKVFLNFMEQSIDRVRSRSRIEFVRERLDNVNFDKIRPYVLAMVNARQALSTTDRQKLESDIDGLKNKNLSSDDKEDKQLKSYELGFLLLNEMGEDFVDKLVEESPTNWLISAPLPKKEDSLLAKIPYFGSKTDVVAYFAFGSNMSTTRMCQRLGHRPSDIKAFKTWSKPTKAVLLGYRRVFNKPDPDDPAKKGFANIVADQNGKTEGVLYQLSRDVIAFIDQHEDGYQRVEVTVKVDGKDSQAQTYVAASPTEGLKPPKEYLETLKMGAEEHGLTQTLDELNCVDTSKDEVLAQP